MATQRAALGVSDPFRTIDVDGVTLGYSDEGPDRASVASHADVPALVCLHAIGHGGGDFDRVRARWRGRRRVVTVDWPGQGRSGSDRVAPSAARYRELLGALLDALEVDRAVLLGNSIGGAAAFRYAARAPERVSGLVLENPGGLDRNDDVVARLAIGAMVRLFSAGAHGAWWYPVAFGAYYRTVLPAAAAAPVRSRVVAAGRELAPLLRDAWRSFAAPDADTRALAPRVACPVLFAWATRDRFVQLRRARPTIDRFPSARVVRFTKAGHAAHLEEPEAFEAELERFLDALPDAGDAGSGVRRPAAPGSNADRLAPGSAECDRAVSRAVHDHGSRPRVAQ